VLTVAVLGPVELRDAGIRLSVPTGKTTEVLVRLALDAGVQVSSDRLIEDLWSDQAAGVARNTLQSKVSQLRRALGDPALVRGGGAGYTLMVDPSCVDALEVLRLAEAVATLRSTGDAAAAKDAAAPALALFHGDLLPGAGDGAWVEPHRARLEEARLRLTEDHLAARLDLGAAGELVGELESLVAAHPLREQLWALLITALYRADRQADALDAYRRVQRYLAEELGLDPGPELRALEERILAQDAELSRTRTSALPGNLPRLPAALVGRTDDLARVTRAISKRRLVTLVGTAGVGKTRLAIEAARESAFSVGAWLARLETAHDSSSIWQTVGEAFGVSAATEPMVLDRLRGQELLLVLDNCEHLLAILSRPVERMLRASDRLHLLATSQAPLGVDGELVHTVEPLTLVDSVALFTQRAVHQRPSFPEHLAAQGHADILEAICRSLDGLPLAIELAAARTKVLTVPEIARRLGDRFTLLADPTTDADSRRSTLQAAIAWSYDLLFPDDQRGLQALACFTGGAPLTAAESVLSALGVPPAATVDVLDRLVDRSMVSADDDMRLQVLDSVRQFGLDRLRSSGLEDRACRAHARWYASAADAAEKGSRGPDQPQHLAFARTERANLDNALAWATANDPATGLRIALGFGWAWAILGAGPDTAERIRDAIRAAADAPALDRSRALLLAGWLEASGGDLGVAAADLDMAAQFGDDEARSVSRLYLAFVRSQQGRPREALDLLAECRPQFQTLGRRWEEGACWLLSAWAEIGLGQLAKGAAACVEALRLLQPLGDQWALSHAEGMLGGLAQAQHRFPDAIAHLERAAAATHRLRFAAAEAHHLANLGRAHEQNADRAAAVATLERSITTARETGDRRTAALAAARLARILRVTGDRTAARGLAAEARDWYVAAGGGEGLLLAEYVLAVLDADESRPEAERELSAVLARARDARDGEVEVLTLDGLARLHAHNSRRTQAREMLDTADALMPAVAHLVTDAERTDALTARAVLGAGVQEGGGGAGELPARPPAAMPDGTDGRGSA
jgi:predicted ATPase/DNA-binding SARP family transcriptional activator